MKSKYPGLVVDNEFMYQEGNLMGALSMQDDPTLASKLNSIAKDIPKNKENFYKILLHQNKINSLKIINKNGTKAGHKE